MMAKQTSRSSEIHLLPQELFFMILSYLNPEDIVRCRGVSRTWQKVFGNPENLIHILKKTFPRAREVRNLFQGRLDELHIAPESGRYWQNLFDRITTRYYHLSCGTPHSIERLGLCRNSQPGSGAWFQVQPWSSHASHVAETVDFVFRDTFWGYENGLLIYPSERHCALVLNDLETGETAEVPFEISNIVIRRLRLKDRLLVVEWAEPEAFHWLNESDPVHRHFATSFIITKTSQGWDISFRNEWKIMFLGHPLSARDRFYSSHTQTHYAIYLWQPNRSLYTADEDAPIESLSVWDISKPTPYRPSLDPYGRSKYLFPDGPSIVARFSFRELGFYSVRQRGRPGIVRLDINSEAGTLDITENILSGPPLDNNSPVTWSSDVQTTSIPFITYGPCWRRKSDVAFPPYRGNGGLEATPLTCGQPWYTAVCEAKDELAQVSFCLQFVSPRWLCDPMKLVLTIRTPRSEITLSHPQNSEIAHKGRICGDERFVIGENDNHELVIFRFQ